MSKIFNQVLASRPKRSLFDLTHERKQSMKFGALTPILCEEVVPGDTWINTSEILLRMHPQLAPVMSRVNVFTHFFFVPNRLVWSNWEKFITGDDGVTTPPTLPYIQVQPTGAGDGPIDPGTLADYLGVQTADYDASGSSQNINALPFKAYQLIYNEYYRDQNLQTEVDIQKDDDGAQTYAPLTALRYRNWEKDYFTSSLPWVQKGGEVSLPLTGNAPVSLANKNDVQTLEDVNGTAYSGAINANNYSYSLDQDVSAMKDIWLDPNGTMEADMSSVTSATVNELRRATRLQRWLEKQARGGSRYIETILNHFGVMSDDARLQRPEYLGGGMQPVSFSEVLQTSSTDATSDQGNMAGHGISVGGTNYFKKNFKEFGYVIGICSVMPRTNYMQGIRKHFLKNDKFDYYWPEFAQLGEQPVLLPELWANFVTAKMSTIFGYQSRYAEYKAIPSSVHSDFRSSLDYWHMGRKFSTEPTLNDEFVELDVATANKVFSDETDNDKMYAFIINKTKAIRPIPYFNVPQL